MSQLFDSETHGAIFSDDRKFRYLLWRKWDEAKPMCMFICLNPSTANENIDDPTIRRVKRFANDWGYGGVYMMNLFPFVTAYPSELSIILCEPEIRRNDELLQEYGAIAKLIVFAWGAFDVMGRDKDIAAMFPYATALTINKDGTPRHPLYVHSETKPKPYDNRRCI